MILLIPAVQASAGGPDVSQHDSLNISPAESAYQKIPAANTTVNVFYNRYCSTCHKALPFIENISRQYSGVTVNYYDVYNSSENLTLFYEFGIHYNAYYVSYPVLFAGESVVLEGLPSINEHTEEVFRSLDAGLIPDREYEKKLLSESYPDNNAVPPDSGTGINVFLVAIAGLIDGVNPCAFAVLVFLLISFTASSSRRGMLFSGFAYVSAVFLFYIMAGLGILRFVEVAGLTYYFSIFAGIVAITTGSINVLNVFSDKVPVSLSIPQSSKGRIDNLMKKASIPAAFLLGIAVGVFELPCTGGIYLAILSLLSSEMTFYEGIPFLVVYNIFFVLPLLLITVAAYFGLSPTVVNEFREHHRVNLKLILGFVLILTGAIVIGWQILL